MNEQTTKRREKTMKKHISLLLASAVIATSLTGCLNNSASSTSTTAAPAAQETTAAAAQDTTAAKEEAPAAAADATYTFNVDNVESHTFALSTTATSGSALADVTHYFADHVNELSGGKIQVDVYEGSALGSEAQNLEALTAGTLDMAIIAVEFYTNSIPQLGAMILPFMYEDYDDVQKVMESEAGEYASQQLLDVAKVKNLGYYVMAFRNMYSTKPINSVDDLAGFKMRVPESSLYVDTFKMMGAAPTPLPAGEVYTALDTGVVEGVENTPDSNLHNSWFEVAPYFNKTNHLNAPTTFSMSAKVFDGLNEDEQNLLMQAGLDASRYGLESTKSSDSEFRKELEDKCEFIDTDVDSMRAKIDYTAYPFMGTDEAKHLFELVQECLK
jgi:tripartite ATP-independent transporter DctP family solute receptor